MSRDGLTKLFFERFIGAHYLWVTFAALCLSALAVWSVATQWNIDSDFKALLPRDSTAFKAMEEVSERVGSGSALFVVVDSPDPEANKRFAGDFAEQLRALDDVALAHFHNDKAFFEAHQLLYLPTQDLETLHQRIRDQIKEEKRRANPLFVSLDDPDEKRDVSIRTDDLGQSADLEHQAYKEYLVSDDGYSLTLVVRFIESSSNLEATDALINRVSELADSLEPSSYHDELFVEYGGGLVRRQQEYRSIVDDVQSSAVFTVIGLFLVIALYFRRARAVLVVLTPLVMGVLWTLALAFPLFGALNTISAFIFAILLGLGIDFSIHLLSGYDHAREEGLSPVDSLISCYSTIGAATVIGATTTFVTFVVISFAQFRGLSQFGKVASIGVAATLLAMLVVLPALVLTFHRIWPHEPGPKGEGGAVAEALGRLSPSRWIESERAGVLVTLFLAVALGLSVTSAASISSLSFEENFKAVGQIDWPWSSVDRDAEETVKDTRRQAYRRGKYLAVRAEEIRAAIEPASYVRTRRQTSVGQKYTSAVSGNQSSTPTILLFDDAGDAERVFEAMQASKAAGELQTVRSVASIYAFMPPGEGELDSAEAQARRLEIMSQIKQTLEEEDLSVLGDSARRKVEELRERLSVSEVTVYDLPPWTRRLFKEAGPAARAPAEGQEFAYEYLIYVNEGIDTMKGAQARRFLDDLRQVREETGVEFRIASQSYVYVAMLDEIKYDGALMMSIALGIVFLILSVAFRGPRRSLIAMIPLLFGAFWMFGLASWLGMRLDFFNVVIIPVIIGLGVDDGVHFYYNYLERGPGSIGLIVRRIGTAIWMTSITSMIGFGGLAITEYEGLQSIGSLAIVGISTTLLATILIMPSILWLAERFDLDWMTSMPGRQKNIGDSC